MDDYISDEQGRLVLTTYFHFRVVLTIILQSFVADDKPKSGSLWSVIFPNFRSSRLSLQVLIFK